MTMQTIGIGTAANDGTGDTLRSAGTKINENFAELYAVSAPNSQTITANGAISLSIGYTICNKATALALTLANATTTGSRIYITNKGVGIATITPANFAQGTTIALDQYDAATLIFDGTNWYVAGHYGATIA
jgi:hypothetical protein